MDRCIFFSSSYQLLLHEWDIPEINFTYNQERGRCQWKRTKAINKQKVYFKIRGFAEKLVIQQSRVLRITSSNQQQITNSSFRFLTGIAAETLQKFGSDIVDTANSDFRQRIYSWIKLWTGSIQKQSLRSVAQVQTTPRISM